MDIVGVLVLLGFLLFFGLMIFFMIRSTRQEKKRKRQVAQQLGFTPIEVDPLLAEKICTLYQFPDAMDRKEVRNLSRKLIANGEMFLFDLVNTSSDEDHSIESQAVAILSPDLKLPQFEFFPKADEKYLLSGIANRVVEWGMSKIGSPVVLPEFPKLDARYLITSNYPDDVRHFLDEPLARFFAQTQMYLIHAEGNIFTFSELDPAFNTSNLESMSHRVNRALELFRMLQRS